MTEGKPIRVLEDMDIASLTWVKLKTHMESRLQKLRADNDKDLRSEEHTSELQSPR